MTFENASNNIHEAGHHHNNTLELGEGGETLSFPKKEMS